jgi:hypothetical protein
MRLLAALAVFTTALLPATVAEDTASKAAALLAPFHQAVQEAVDPWGEDLDANALLESTSELADKHILPVRAQLHELAKANLGTLEVRQYDFRDYELRLSVSSRENPLPERRPGATTAGMLVFEFWNPVRAAHRFKEIALARQVGLSAVGLHKLRDRLAPPLVYAVSADAAKPVVALESGKELCVVELTYDEGGFYWMSGIRLATRNE